MWPVVGVALNSKCRKGPVVTSELAVTEARQAVQGARAAGRWHGFVGRKATSWRTENSGSSCSLGVGVEMLLPALLQTVWLTSLSPGLASLEGLGELAIRPSLTIQQSRHRAGLAVLLEHLLLE